LLSPVKVSAQHLRSQFDCYRPYAGGTLSRGAKSPSKKIYSPGVGAGAASVWGILPSRTYEIRTFTGESTKSLIWQAIALTSTPEYESPMSKAFSQSLWSAGAVFHRWNLTFQSYRCHSFNHNHCFHRWKTGSF